MNRTTLNKIVPIIVTVLGILVIGLKILSTQIEPYWDQAFISYTFSLSDYPQYAQGISIHLFVGLYNLVDAYHPVSSNAHIRTLVMVLYLVSGYLLFSSLSKSRPALTVLLIGLLITSRFPILWTSHELFAGACLMIALWSVAADRSFAITVIATTLFALAKPDLIFSGLLVGLYLAWTSSPMSTDRFRNMGIQIALILVLLLPGVIQYGWDQISTNRAFDSFSQHYASAVYDHQLDPDKPSPWEEADTYIDAIWGPDIDSVAGAIRSRPSRYLDFVFLSMSQSLRNFYSNNILFLLPLMVVAVVHMSDTRLKIAVLLFLTGLIPITLVSYTHTRYLARFYPLVLAVIAAYLADLPERFKYTGGLAYLALVLLRQIYMFSLVFPSGHWAPD